MANAEMGKGWDLPNFEEDTNESKRRRVTISPIEAHTQFRTILNDSELLLEKHDIGLGEQRATWISKLKAQKETKLDRTVIAVVGNSGAGKSSLINSLLGEPRFLFVSGCQAATAMATVLRYNFKSDYYVAKIQFMSRPEFEYYCQKSLQDSLGAERMDKGAEGALRALFPNLSKNEFSMDAFREDATVRSKLGEVIEIKRPREELVDHLRQFTENKVRKNWEDLEGEEKIRRPPQWWPLITQIKIAAKWPLLRCGAILVDLPGFGDTNQARVKVAQKWIQKADLLWVVTSIKRALTDETAQTLLGRAFRQQLRMDGHCRSFTLICTQTDDVDTRFAEEEFHVKGVAEMREEMAKMRQKVQEKKKAGLSEASQLQDILNLQDKLRSHEGEIKQMCVRARNQHVKDKMPAVLHKLLQYGQLHVFCVSAKEYDALKDESEQEGQICPAMEETEIPSLQRYLSDVAEEQQSAAIGHNIKLLHSDLDVVFNVVNEALEKGELDARMSEEYFDIQMKTMGEQLHEIVKEQFCALEEKTWKPLQKKLKIGAHIGSNRAVAIATTWREDTLHWNTLKAVVRRNGEFKVHNFNAALADPLLVKIEDTWDRAFSAEVGKALQELTRKIVHVVAGRVEVVSACLQTLGLPHKRASSIRSAALKNVNEAMEGYLKSRKRKLTLAQRGVWRKIVDKIKERMEKAYSDCLSEEGSGMRNRMNDILEKHVDDNKTQIFDEAADATASEVKTILMEAVDGFRDKALSLQRDLRAAYSVFWKDIRQKTYNPYRMRFVKEVQKLIAKLDALKSDFGIEQGNDITFEEDSDNSDEEDFLVPEVEEEMDED
ncbi:hypothetical protein HK104_011433 [Borealophlyctis nickersoniae]|nr:hypothetical protein HK104_011433 [Borealophlyctis nickersoniae]